MPADGIGLANTANQAFRGGLKKLVAGRMSQGIIDMLEAIQVQEQHRDLVPVTGGERDRLADPVAEQQPVGQAGEEIMLGRMKDFQRHRPGGADIAQDDDRAGDVSFTVMDRGYGILDRNFGAVAADQDAVRRQMSAAVQSHRFLHRIGDGFAARRIDEAKNLSHRAALRLLGRPARHRFRNEIEKGDPA